MQIQHQDAISGSRKVLLIKSYDDIPNMKLALQLLKTGHSSVFEVPGKKFCPLNTINLAHQLLCPLSRL